MSALEERYRAVQARIDRAKRTAPGPITLLAVSKFQPVEAIEALYGLGHRDFGENYVQELVTKAQALAERGCDGIRWHFIGHLQSNKVKALLPWVSVVHTVDSLKLAERLSSTSAAEGRTLPVFLEVNLDAEGSKAGVAPSQLEELAEGVHRLAGLELLGLMAIPQPPAPTASPEERARPFARLRQLGEGLGGLTRNALSMGMSGDFETALGEGATHVRVGSGIFGERPPKA